MSNLHARLQCLAGGIVDHKTSVCRDINSLYLDSEYSDVTLKACGHSFHAHKVILAARSQYFRALLFGGLKESHQDEIEIQDATLASFTILLRYIYSGVVNLGIEQEENVLDVLGLAHEYGFLELESSICDYLKDSLCTNNVCVIYDMASLYNLRELSVFCEDFIDKNATTILSHESFLNLSAAALKSIISRDSFCASEIQIFQGIRNWYANNKEIDETKFRSIISQIRLPLISLMDLLNAVRPTGLISPDTILDAIKAKNESRDTELQYRGYLMPNENVASESKEAVVLLGELRPNLLDGNVSIYDMDRGFTRHPIDGNNGQGLLVKLGRQCIINHMRLLLWDKDHRAYSYFIEVSMDQKDWVRVVDHTKYFCRSWQFLFFPPRVVKYIKIVGTNNTINRVFHAVAFEAYFLKHVPNVHKGIVAPKDNIALVNKSAKVIEGVSRARNNLLNCDINHYNWDSGYTCHQLGSGCICIQLGQPYYLSSCKLLLWDCDDRSYSYYIESSTNGREWEIVADKTREPCRSWQTINFTPRAVVYFKIVGTFNTANEVFHLVHFEAPAQSGSELLHKGSSSAESRPLDETNEGQLQQPSGVDIRQAPLRPPDTNDLEDNDQGEASGRWMAARSSPPSDVEAGERRKRSSNVQGSSLEGSDYEDVVDND